MHPTKISVMLLSALIICILFDSIQADTSDDEDEYETEDESCLNEDENENEIEDENENEIENEGCLQPCRDGNLNECVRMFLQRYSNRFFNTPNVEERHKYRYVREYYILIASNILPGAIWPVDFFCLQTVRRDAAGTLVDDCIRNLRVRCRLTQTNPLQIFVDTYYYKEFEREGEYCNILNFNIAFLDEYLKHISKNVFFESGIKTATQFCSVTQL